jgi:hypothetical protein
MDFTPSRPDVIRAANQRWLLNQWVAHRGDGDLPPWSKVDLAAFARISIHLSTLEVVRDHMPPRFMLRDHPMQISEMYGLGDCRGRLLDEVLPAHVREQGLAPYRQAASGERPAYTIFELADRAGRVVHFERLLLPYTSTGRQVDFILGSFEYISPDGAFESRDLMKEPGAPPVLQLACTIVPPAAR